MVLAKDCALFYYTKLTLLFCGCWELESNDSIFVKVGYEVYSKIVAFLGFSGPAMFAVNVPVLAETDVASALGAFSKFLYSLLVFTKMMFCKTRAMVKLINVVFNDDLRIFLNSKDEVKGIFMEHVKSSKNLAIFILLCGVIGGSLFCTIGILFLTRQNIKQASEAENFTKKLLLEFWYPLSREQRNYYHNWILLHQIFFMVAIVLEMMCVQILNNSIMIYFKARIKILQAEFRKFGHKKLDELALFKENDTICGKQKVKNLIVEHQELIRNIKNYNDTTQNITLLEFALFGIMTATTIFQVTEENDVAQNIIITFVFCSQLIIIAWNANELIFESTALTHAIYDSNWMDQSKEVNIMLLVMILRCQKPLCITIGPFGPMTAYAGISQLKMAYSYTSLMTRIK